MRTLPLVVLVTPLLLLLACATTRREVEVTPAAVPEELRGASWEEFPLSYCFAASEGEGFASAGTVVAASKRAFEHWGREVVYDGMCSSPTEEGNGRNEISWGELEAGEGSVSKAGITRLRYRRLSTESTPNIVEADIVLDSEPPARLRSEDCLYSTLLHEAGHFLGLHHLSGDAIMAPVVTSCRDDLTDADRQALEELYGS